jgi:hypothetical protein
MRQWPRTSASKRPALARSGGRLVPPAITSARTSPVFFVMPWRAPCNTWARPITVAHQHGTGLQEALLDATGSEIERFRSGALLTGHRSAGKNGLNSCQKLGLMVFDHPHRVAPRRHNLVGHLAWRAQGIPGDHPSVVSSLPLHNSVLAEVRGERLREPSRESKRFMAPLAASCQPLRRKLNSPGLRGITSNPATFHKAVVGSSAYDAQIKRLVDEGETSPRSTNGSR